MTKKVFTMVFFFAFLANVSAQVEVHSSNQVGIGTSTPQYKLHVVGDVFATGNHLGNFAGNFYLESASNFLGTTGNYPVILKSNNVRSGYTGSVDSSNVSFGYEALLKNLNPTAGNTAVGFRTLSNAQYYSLSNTAIGSHALYSNTTGSYNTANGDHSLYLNKNGNQNVANGYRALYNNTSGYANVANGFDALYTNTTGGYNIANGSYALYNNTGGSYNIANGSYALYSNTTGSNNIANGDRSLYSNTTGSNNIANGSYALYNNTTGYSNIANGSSALYNNTSGYRNIANGFGALYYNTDGSYNTADGDHSLYSNTTGYQNSAIGNRALSSSTEGSHNTAVGSYALSSNTTGSLNSAISSQALKSNTTGKGNAAIGYLALYYNKEGNYNTAIGYNCGTNDFNTVINNSTAIGYGATVNASDQVRIGNNTVTSIGGYVAWSNVSDGRMKKNVRKDVPGLAFIKSLQPVTYNLDLDAVDELIKSEEPILSDEDINIPPKSPELIEIERKSRAAKEKLVQTGFVAQEVEKAAKDVGYDFSGVDVDETGIYSLRYAEFVVPLVKAVQELSEQNDRLLKLVDELNKRLEKLEQK